MRKNEAFLRRLGFALSGISTTFRKEANFRTQVLAAAFALATLAVLQTEPVWWAIFVLIIGAVLSAELINTALECALDRLHPEHHPLIGLAKDCAAGAVLVLSFTALIIFGALLFQRFG